MACETESYDGACGTCGCPKWPLSQEERARLALAHEPEASASPDGFRLATCVVCEKPMVAMWHLWLDAGGLKKEIHMCQRCATDVYGAPDPGQIEGLWKRIQTQVIDDDFLDLW